MSGQPISTIEQKLDYMENHLDLWRDLRANVITQTQHPRRLIDGMKSAGLLSLLH